MVAMKFTTDDVWRILQSNFVDAHVDHTDLPNGKDVISNLPNKGKDVISNLPNNCKDLISNLPKDVRYRIMEGLPLRDAARMSTLSKQWKEVWLTLPSLVLDGDFFREVLQKERNKKDEYSRIVSKILLQHNGPISKFTLHISRHIEEHPDLVQWIMFLSINCINDFYLNNWNKGWSFTLPSQLFSCANLTKLKLDFCVFNPPSSFKGFRKLISLELLNIYFQSDEDVLGSFVAKCSSLEKLTLHQDQGINEVLNLVINAPNLKFMTICSTFRSICLDGSKALSSISLTLHELAEHPMKQKAQDLIKFLTSKCRIENLSFRKYSIKFLVAGGVSKMLPLTFAHVRSLRLTSIYCCEDLSCAIGIIQSCPNVEKLQISVKISENTDDSIEDNWRCNLSNKFPQLRCINVRLNTGSGEELKLIEFLLASSPVLQTFNVEIFQELNADTKTKISKKLMQFHRASTDTVFLILTKCFEDKNFDS